MTFTPLKKYAVAALVLAGLNMPFAGHAQIAGDGGSRVKGAIDFHVHTAPDVSARSLTDVEIAQIAARHEMRAIVLKNHVAPTSDRAAQVQQLVPGIEVFGGIVLNNAVGGINASAVGAMARMAGKRGRVVWLPTADSAHHRAMVMGIKDQSGLRVAVDGKVTPETEAVLQAIKQFNLILETGHISPEEIMLVVRRAKEIGIKNVVITHAMSTVPGGPSLDQMKELAKLGAFIELVYLDHLRTPHAHMDWLKSEKVVSIAAMADAVKAIGAESFIIASDLGQTGNPIHPDGMILMVEGLIKAGVSEADVGKMMRINPANLLDLKLP